MPATRQVPDGTVDFSTVQLHELLDILRRRTVCGDPPFRDADASPPCQSAVPLPVDVESPESLRAQAVELVRKATPSKAPPAPDPAHPAESPPPVPVPVPDPDPRHVHQALARQVRPWGLAFSGGGVRSASFCLGFLQSLAEQDAGRPADALRKFDYLSTVSGGGYTGGMLSALAHRVRQDAEGQSPAQHRQAVLDHLTRTEPIPVPGGTQQPFWTRLLHRGQSLGQLLPFLSRHVASTVVFNLALLGGLVFVTCALALLWRELDRPPLHTFIMWSSNTQVLEYNRPLLIPLAVFTCYLVVALSRWDCNWGLRVLALVVPMVVFGAWLGLPYFIVLSTVLVLFGMCLTLFSGTLRRRHGFKQYEETNRVFWAAAMLFLVVTAKVMYLIALTVTVTGGDPPGERMLSYTQLALWTAGMVVLGIGWLFYLSNPRFRQNHLRLDKVMLVATGLSALAGAAIWLATPNMNFASHGTLGQLWSGSQDVLNVVVAAIIALLLPFVRLETVLRSGMKARSTVQRRLFNVFSIALLLGVPFLLITKLGRHNVSGYATDMPRNLGPGEVNWELVLRRMEEANGAPIRSVVASGAVSAVSSLHPPAPAPAYDAFLYEHLKTKVARDRANADAYDTEKGRAAVAAMDRLLRSANYVRADPPDAVGPRWLTAFVEQTDVAVPVNPDTWPGQIRRFRDGARLSELASEELRDPTFVLAMLRDADVQRDVDRRIEEAVRQDAQRPSAAARKSNAERLRGKLAAARARAADPAFARDVAAAAAAEADGRPRAMAKDVREELETISLLAFATVYQDVPGNIPPGFVSRPVNIDRDQLVRLVLCVLTFVLFLTALRTVDLNWASPLSFYRRQLREAYLSEPAPPGAAPRPHGAGPRNDPALSALDNCAIGLPYHLVGCSVDVNDARREPRRQLDYFLFSRRYCGAAGLGGPHPGEHGFRPTAAYALRDETASRRAAPVRLADVIAISGAAVTPVRYDNWLMRVVLTVTNFRLGQWIPHPADRSPARSTLWNAAQDWPGWDESMVHNRLVFVADGGFHDNLGLEALLDRRCETIVLVDAGADPNFTFADLTRVIQRVGLRGIRFTAAGSDRPFDLSPLLPRDRKSKDGVEEAPPTADVGAASLVGGLVGTPPPELGTFGGRLSERHFVTACIRYPEPGAVGRLICIKPTFNGDEPPELKTFRKANPVFPHHSTVEQLFDWSMVDAYRRLGHHVGKDVIRELFPPTPTDQEATMAPTGIDRQTLQQELDARFTQHEQHLIEKLREELKVRKFDEALVGHIEDLRAFVQALADDLGKVEQQMGQMSAKVSDVCDAMKPVAAALELLLKVPPSEKAGNGNGTGHAKKKTPPTKGSGT